MSRDVAAALRCFAVTRGNAFDDAQPRRTGG